MKRLDIKSIVIKKYQYQKNHGTIPDDKENIFNRDFNTDTVFNLQAQGMIHSLCRERNVQLFVSKVLT